MSKEYRRERQEVKQDAYFVLSRKYFGKTKVFKTIQTYVSYINYSVIIADDLKKFEKWLEDVVKKTAKTYDKEDKLKVEYHPNYFDGNGMMCKEYCIYIMQNGLPKEISRIYLYRITRKQVFKVFSERQELPLFKEGKSHD